MSRRVGGSRGVRRRAYRGGTAHVAVRTSRRRRRGRGGPPRTRPRPIRPGRPAARGRPVPRRARAPPLPRPARGGTRAPAPPPHGLLRRPDSQRPVRARRARGAAARPRDRPGRGDRGVRPLPRRVPHPAEPVPRRDARRPDHVRGGARVRRGRHDRRTPPHHSGAERERRRPGDPRRTERLGHRPPALRRLGRALVRGQSRHPRRRRPARDADDAAVSGTRAAGRHRPRARRGGAPGRRRRLRHARAVPAARRQVLRLQPRPPRGDRLPRPVRRRGGGRRPGRRPALLPGRRGRVRRAHPPVRLADGRARRARGTPRPVGPVRHALDRDRRRGAARDRRVRPGRPRDAKRTPGGAPHAQRGRDHGGRARGRAERDGPYSPARPGH